MKNKKILIAIGILVLIVIVVIVWVMIKKPASQTSSLGTGNTGASVQNQTQVQTPKENYIQCDVGGGKVKVFGIDSAEYNSANGSTYLGANELGKSAIEAKSTVFIAFKGQTTGSQNNIGTNKNHANVNINYVSDGSDSYETYVDNGDAIASITKYSGNNIEGTASGTLTFVALSGQDNSRTAYLKCSFSSNLPIAQK